MEALFWWREFMGWVKLASCYRYSNIFKVYDTNIFSLKLDNYEFDVIFSHLSAQTFV